MSDVDKTALCSKSKRKIFTVTRRINIRYKPYNKCNSKNIDCKQSDDFNELNVKQAAELLLSLQSKFNVKKDVEKLVKSREQKDSEIKVIMSGDGTKMEDLIASMAQLMTQNSQF